MPNPGEFLAGQPVTLVIGCGEKVDAGGNNVVDFLPTDAASFINGIDIAVDSGHRAGWRTAGVIQR